jgi:hypothetical protein
MAPDCEALPWEKWAHLPGLDIRVRILQAGQAPIGIQQDEWLLFDVRDTNELHLVGKTKLLEDESNLPRIGGWAMIVEDERL